MLEDLLHLVAPQTPGADVNVPYCTGNPGFYADEVGYPGPPRMVFRVAYLVPEYRVLSADIAFTGHISHLLLKIPI